MEEPDSSDSDAEQQTKIQKTQHVSQRLESDESYSDSDSDEIKEPKSMYNVYKTGHVPGKYKQSIDPEADQQSARVTHDGTMTDLIANTDIQALETNTVQVDCGGGGENADKKEEILVTPHLLTGQELVFTETGIFEKSMIMIPSLSVDGADKKKVNDTVMPKVHPPIPPKPSRDISLLSKPVDFHQTIDTSLANKPKPAPRKSKGLKEVSSEGTELQTDEKNIPVPARRPKTESDEIDVSSEALQTKFNSEVESEVFVKMSDSTEIIENSKKDVKTNTEENDNSSLIDTIDIGSASKDTGKENNTEDHTYVLDTDDTIELDTVMKDMTDTFDSQQPVIPERVKKSETETNVIDPDKSQDIKESESTSFVIVNSDSETEENATFENDFQDTDSAKDDKDKDQNSSDSESDGPFRTPDNRTDDEDYEYYDSNMAVTLHDLEKIDTDTKADETESKETKDLDNDDNDLCTDDKRDLDKTNETKKDFEESDVLDVKGSTREPGYVSISSTISSSELTEITLSVEKKVSDNDDETKPSSVRDRVSIFENIGQKNEYNIEKSSRDSGDEASRKTDELTQHFNQQTYHSNSEDSKDEYLEDGKPPPIPPKSELVLESMKSNFTEDPPIISPKSELVLESMRSNITEDAPTIPPRSLAEESDCNKTGLDANSPSHVYVRSNTDYGMTDTQQNSSFKSEKSATEDDQTSTLPQGNVQQEIPAYHQQQHQMPTYQNMQYLQQNQQTPMWPSQYYYTDEKGNIQYVNPCAFYNPNMNPGIFNQAPNAHYYQQPQYFSHQMYATGQTPYTGAGNSFHQDTSLEDDQYEEVCPPEREQHERYSSHAEHRQFSSLKHRSTAHDEHRQSPDKEHRNIDGQKQTGRGRHEAHKTDGLKLTKSKSNEPIKEKAAEKESSSSHVRRSTSTPNYSWDKPDRSKEKKKRRLEVDVQKESEEDSKNEDYYIYFKGINPVTEKENLGNFIEVTTRGVSDPEKIIFNHSRTCALVTVSMSHNPDISKVAERIRSRGIEGEKPEVYEVQSPDSIAVSSDEDIKSTESLGLYFESRKVGDAELKQDPYESEDGSCFIIQFGDPDVVKRICERQSPHIWEGRELRVSPCFECKGGAIWDSELHVVKIPGPVVVSLEPNYLLLLQRDCCKQLLANLEDKHCRPTFTDKGLQLECTLTPRTASFRSLVKDWEDASRRTVETYIGENVFEETLNSSDQVWKDLMVFFKAEKIQERADLATSVNNSGFVIMLVGFKDTVSDVFTKLFGKQKEIEKQICRKTETISCDALKLRLLETVGFFDEVKKDTDQLEIYIGEGEITVDGQPEDIITVRIKILDTDSKISAFKWKHNFSFDFVEFIQTKLVSKITAILKKNAVIAEWQIDKVNIAGYVFEGQGAAGSKDDDYENINEEYFSYSNVDDASTNVKDLLKSAIVEMQEDVQDSFIEVMTSPEWTSFIESMTEDYENVAEVEFKEATQKIVIYGMKMEAQHLLNKVKDFIEENAVKEDTIKCGTINVKFISLHKKELAETLEKKFEHLKVKIIKDVETLTIRGTKAGIAETKKELMKVFNSIICEKYTIQKVAVKDVFRDAQDQGTIDVVEKETKCLIKLPGENATLMHQVHSDDPSDDSDDGYEVPIVEPSQAAPPPPIEKGFKSPNGVKVTLVKGELGQQDGNIIVVTTSPNLNLSSGNACKSVLRAGGQQLQDECKERYQNEIKFGEIAVIHGAGSLECNEVYLTTLPNWNSENSPKQVLEKVMKDCLEKASNDKKYSILFCAMGTGQLKYPTDLVAMLMYQAVIDFDQNNPQTTLKDVRFVLYQKDFPTIKVFEEEEQLRLEGGSERPTFDLKAGNISIELSVENIAQQKVDGILCSTSPNMDLSRNGACQALLRAGGKSLQDECKSKHNNKLEEGQVVEIGGGKLSCKLVFLTVLPGYSTDAIGILSNVIQTLLGLANAKKLTSLAIPALGTGFLKYPKDEVCKCMFETVSDWSQKNPTSSVKTVRFIMHAKDHGVIQMFKFYIVNAKGRGRRGSRRFTMDPKQPVKATVGGEKQKSLYNAHADGVQIGKIKLNVFKDDIILQKTDAIVSSVGHDFEFVGAVANELKTKFPKIEAECQKKEQIQMLRKDGVVLTKGFGLRAKTVVHVDFAEKLSTWQARMYRCLEKLNNKSLRSVAFPVLGTGKGFKSFSPDAIAGCLFDAISEFVQANKNPSLKEVRLIVYKGQPFMYDPIMNKLHQKIQEATVSTKYGWGQKISKTVRKFGKSALDAITGKEDGVESMEGRKKLMELASNMEVHIYSDSKMNIDNCKKELDAKLEKVYIKKKIEDYKEIIKSLTQEEMKELDIFALANIKIDKQAGIITINGPMKQVSDVAHKLQEKLLKIERRRFDVNAADELYKIVQWHYEEVTNTEFKLTPYSKRLNQRIEKAYKNNQSDFEFEDDDGDKFVIDFQQLIEYRKSDDQDKLRVLRKDILKSAASALPEEWTAMKDNETIKVVSLPATDQTYKDIEQRFLSEVKTGSYAHRLNFNPGNMQVNKIERIQNRTLYQQYQAKKKHMAEQKPNLPANMPIEKELWHGTKSDAVSSIQMHGFNRSYSGNANGQPWYGDGVYFAANASYSARGWLSGAGPGSKGYMFLVKTLTGHFCKGQKGLRYLPPVDPKDPTLLYDCAVDDPANPMEFVIFNDTQAYPAYLITFTT